MGPDSIFRALLNLAFQRCPREDRVNTYRTIGNVLDDDEDEEIERGRNQKKFTPWIEKFWIFGLLDTEEAKNEKDGGQWQPAHAHFLSDLYTYIDGLVKTQGVLNEDMSVGGTSPTRRTPGAKRTFLQDGGGIAEEVVPSTSLFEEGLQELRATFQDSHAIAGNQNVCMRTARNRRTLHASMLDEIGYHSLIQYLPPPLFILLVGDLPPVDLLPWPTVLQETHLHVLGTVPSVCAYRDISPALTVQSWNSWAESTADDRITTTSARHIAVPWA